MSNRRPGEGIRVLIVDDEKAHAQVVAETLERQGYECSIATSGVAGARLLDQDEFDVVLTDLRMAEVDGMEILRKARSEEHTSELQSH